MTSPAMITIIPIQDLMGMDDDIKREDAAAEQINVPSNVKHYWQYRMHITLEDLLANQSFCDMVRELNDFRKK